MVTARVGILVGNDQEKANKDQRTRQEESIHFDEATISNGRLSTLSAVIALNKDTAVGPNIGPPGRTVFTHSPT